MVNNFMVNYHKIGYHRLPLIEGNTLVFSAKLQEHQRPNGWVGGSNVPPYKLDAVKATHGRGLKLKIFLSWIVFYLHFDYC